MYKFKECNQCPHEFNDKNLEPCKDCVPKKQTNADYIRNMTDKELAEFLRATVIQGGCNLFSCSADDCNNDDVDCKGCRRFYDWLKAEREE